MKENRQNQNGNRIRENNGGLTLVELLVSIAVLLVVSTAIFAFILTGSRFYNRHSAEADMQSEAQIMKNYLDDLIRDTGRGLTYYEDGYKGADRCLIIYGEETIAFLGWIQSEEKVHYLEKGKDSIRQDGDSYVVSFEEWENNAANWPLLSEYVKSFSISLEKLTEQHQLFVCDMEFSLRQREMKTAHTITLRNQIVNAERLEEIYDDLDENVNKVLGITLNPQMIDRSQGGTVQYESNVIGTGTVSQDVVYGVTGNQSDKTTINRNGLLMVGIDETATILTITATSVEDASVSATATVNIVKITGITIEALTDPQYQGSYYPEIPVELRADVEGDFLGENSKEVIWSVAENTEIPEEKFTWHQNGIYCTVEVKDDESIYGKRVIMKAASKLNPSVWATYEIPIAKIKAGELIIVSATGEFRVKRNSTLDLDAYVSGMDTDDNEYTWEITDYGGINAGELSIDANGVIRAEKRIQYKRNFSFTVQATWKRSGHETLVSTCQVIIDEVTIRFVPEYAVIIVPGNGTQEEIKIQIEGLIPDSGDLRQSGNTGINSIMRGDSLFLSIDKDKQMNKKEMMITFSLSPGTPGAPSVKNDVTVYFYQSNFILNGTERYVPIPGDSFLPDTEKPGVPDTNRTTEIEGVTYGYKAVTVQGITYEYLVEKSVNNAWYMRVQGEKYIYDGTRYVKIPK